MKDDLDGPAKCMETPTPKGSIFTENILEKIVRGIFRKDEGGGTNHLATISKPELRAITILEWTKIEDLIDPNIKRRFMQALDWVVRDQVMTNYRFTSYNT